MRLIDADAMIDKYGEWYTEEGLEEGFIGTLKGVVNMMPTITQPEQRWIPIKWHDCTDEEREKYGFSNDIVAVFDNKMPGDGQEILITTSYGSVEKDVCYIEDGFSLDSG